MIYCLFNRLHHYLLSPSASTHLGSPPPLFASIQTTLLIQPWALGLSGDGSASYAQASENLRSPRSGTPCHTCAGLPAHSASSRSPYVSSTSIRAQSARAPYSSAVQHHPQLAHGYSKCCYGACIRSCGYMSRSPHRCSRTRSPSRRSRGRFGTHRSTACRVGTLCDGIVDHLDRRACVRPRLRLGARAPGRDLILQTRPNGGSPVKTSSPGDTGNRPSSTPSAAALSWGSSRPLGSCKRAPLQTSSARLL